MAEKERQRSRRARWVGAAIVLLLGAGFLLCCSGLPIPMLSPRSNLNGMLRSDFAVELPGAVVIERSARIATQDPAKCFLLRFATREEALAFARQLRAEAKARGYQVDERTPAVWTMGAVPSWWRPGEIKSVERFDVLIERQNASATGYMVFVSGEERTMYLFWFET